MLPFCFRRQIHVENGNVPWKWSPPNICKSNSKQKKKYIEEVIQKWGFYLINSLMWSFNIAQSCIIWLKLEELVYFAGLSNRFDPLPCKKLLFCTCSLYTDLLRTNMQNNDLLITKIYRIPYMQSYPTKFHFKCCPSENKKNKTLLSLHRHKPRPIRSFLFHLIVVTKDITVLTDGSKATQGSTFGLTCNYQWLSSCSLHTCCLLMMSSRALHTCSYEVT